MLADFIPSSSFKLYTTIFDQIYLQFTSFGKWRIDWIFIPIQHSFVNCRWCIFVDISYIMMANNNNHSIPLYCLSILLSNKNMMKAVTSQLMLLQDFGKIGVFVKLRKTFRNSQNWETPMFFLVCWKPHYVAEKWQHHKVAQKLPKGGKLETSVILRKFPKMRRQKIKFLILQTKDILWSCICFARSINSSSILVVWTTWCYLYQCLILSH